jgi:hypothetical protein
MLLWTVEGAMATCRSFGAAAWVPFVLEALVLRKGIEDKVKLTRGRRSPRLLELFIMRIRSRCRGAVVDWKGLWLKACMSSIWSVLRKGERGKLVGNLSCKGFGAI